MKIQALKYLFVYIVPVVVIFSISSSGIWTFTALILLFGILPFLELFTKGSTENMTQVEEDMALKNIGYDLLLYSLVPIQYFTVVYFLYSISDEHLTLASKIGMTIAMGLSCGVLGINAAHELGHRSTWYEQLMSKMLLLTSMYMHFFIEHNRGHHKNVSTDEDPASAKYGENIYRFYVRTITESWISAWRLEIDRLNKSGFSFWSFRNEMIVFQVIQISFLAVIYFVFGFSIMLWYFAAAHIGFMLLETVNYIEHYGLRRKKIGNRYERTLPIHSWNSNHPYGRLVLLELSRHSDHHYLATRKYQVLRHFDESPQMPTGYPGMMILALVPPLWFRLMHKEIEKYQLG